MVVVGSFKSSLGIVRDNPIILGVAFLYMLIGVPGTALQTIPEISTLLILAGLSFLLSLLITPFFLGGIFEMVGEAIEKRSTRLSTFIQEGKRNYVSLLIAYILFAVIIAVPTMGLMLGGVVIGASAEKFIFVLVAPLIGLLLFLVLMFFLQFFDVGVVFNRYGVIETFKKSAGFVRKRKASKIHVSRLSST